MSNKLLSKSNLKNGGFSIVEVMVAVGITSILGLSLMNLSSDLRKETRSLEQKIDVLGFEKHLLAVMADGSLCKRTVVDTTYTFNSSDLSNVNIPIAEIKASSNILAPTLIAANPGTSLGSSGVKVNSIQFTSFVEIGPNQYSANLVVGLDASQLVRAIRPIEIKLNLFTSTPDPMVPNNKQIIDCSPPKQACIVQTCQFSRGWAVARGYFGGCPAGWSFTGTMPAGSANDFDLGVCSQNVCDGSALIAPPPTCPGTF